MWSKKLTTEQELKLWKDVEAVLNSIPNDMRSQNHTNYLREVEGRVQETKWLVEHK